MPNLLLPPANIIVADLFKNSVVFTCGIGRAPNDSVWSQVFNLLNNGNNFMVSPEGEAQIRIKAGAIFHTIGPITHLPIILSVDKIVSSSVVAPINSRSFPGGKIVMSEDSVHNETLFIIANKFNHLVALGESSIAKFAIVATDTIDFPADLIPLQTGGVTFQKVATIKMSVSQKLSFIDNPASAVNLIEVVSPSASPIFLNWQKTNESVFSKTNAIQIEFVFPAGIATGKFGEFTLTANGKVIGYSAFSPQLDKEPDIPAQVFWNIIFGEPQSFLV